MTAAFKNHLELKFPELGQHSFIVACSGGVDSVALVHLCAKLGLRFAIAHCNFNLRAAAAADAQFVSQLAKQLELPYFENSFNTALYVEKHKVSVQMAARDLRYQWFQELVKETEFKLLLTAHHRDDALETMLINLSRGTGIEGLLGIPEKRDYLRRPLLNFSRDELQKFMTDHSFHWREDHTNKDSKYLRNKIRHELLPLFKSLHPTALDNMLQTQAYLSQTAALSKIYIQELKVSLWTSTANRQEINLEKLMKLPALPATLYALFSPFGFVNPMAILTLCNGEVSKKLVSESHVLLKDRLHLLLFSHEDLEVTNDIYLINPDTISLAAPILLDIQDKIIPIDHKWSISLNKALLKYPLKLRHIRDGDVFYPSGMVGKKKLTKYLRDQKISVISKKTIWVLADVTDQIIWVVGHRVDRRFQAHSNTEQIICLKTIP